VLFVVSGSWRLRPIHARSIRFHFQVATSAQSLSSGLVGTLHRWNYPCAGTDCLCTAQPSFRFLRVVAPLLALDLGRLVAAPHDPFTPEPAGEPFIERWHLLGVRWRRVCRLDRVSERWSDCALLGLFGPDLSRREIVVRPRNSGRTEEAQLLSIGVFTVVRKNQPPVLGSRRTGIVTAFPSRPAMTTDPTIA